MVRSPKWDYEARKFVPCSYCYGFFHERELVKHTKTCHYKAKDFTVGDPLEQGRLLVLSSMNLPTSEEVKTQILLRMRNDNVKLRLQNDHLILAYANLLVTKHRASKGEKYQHVSQILRNCTRLLLECERIDKSSISMLDLVVPANFDLVVRAVQNLCVGDKKPKSLGLKIGNDLWKIVNLAQSMAIKCKNETRKADAEDFLSLMCADWSDLVSSSLIREIYDEKLGKDVDLPLTSDIVKLSTHINQSLKVCQYNMGKQPLLENYLNLARITLCKLVVFNKRRGGEVSRILINDLVHRPKWSSKNNEDIYEGLSELEKELTKRLDLIKVTGKRGRHVPILLPPDTVKAMETLTKNWCHIGNNSKYGK